MIVAPSGFAATEVAIYHSDEDAWYRLGDEPFKIQNAVKGQPAKTFVRVKAMCYMDAHEQLFGHVVSLPPQTRQGRHIEDVPA
jgi:hypothetical protein